MSLESATYVGDLVTTNPPGTDLRSQGDDHIRLLKSVLKTTFPNATRPFYFPDSMGKTADYTVVAADNLKFFTVDTTSGVVNLTLPTLTVGDAGWGITVLKTNLNTTPIFILPASGTLTSGEIPGLTRARRCIPGAPFRILWAGSTWWVERIPRVPVGSVLDFAGASLSWGYEWPNGQTLSSSTNYPEYNSVRGGLTTPDLRGRAGVGKDDMGGSAAGRLTTAGGGVDGVTLGAVGGAQNISLTTSEMPVHLHNNVLTDPGHIHGQLGTSGQAGPGAATGLIQNFTSGSGNGSTATATTGVSITNAFTGDGAAHNNVQPTIVMNKILVAE